MEDLVFGDRGQVVVVDGKSDFTPIASGEDGAAHFLYGGLIGDPPEVLTTSERRGDLFGRFVLLTHDAREGTVTVSNDRYGSLPFYHAEAGGKLYLSPRIRPLVARGLVRDTLDETTLSSLLACNRPPGDRSLVRGVRVLEPASTLTVRLDDLARERREEWDPVALLGAERVPFAEVKDELVEAFLLSCGKCMAGAEKLGVTLSGGLDSRCNLAAMVKLGEVGKASAYHISVAGSRSYAYARRIAEMVGIPFHSLSLGVDFARRYLPLLRSVVRVTEGMTFNSEAEGHWLRDQVEESTVILHGGYAELVKMSDMRSFRTDPELLKTNRDTVVDFLWRRCSRRFASRLELFTDEARERLAGEAEKHFCEPLREVVDKNPGFGPAEIAQVGYMREGWKAEKYSAAVWNDRVTTRFPFSFPRFVDTVLKVRVRDKQKPVFHAELLRAAAPRLFRFPDANTGTRIDAPALKKKAAKLVGKVMIKLFRSKYYYEHADFATWMSSMEPSPEEYLMDRVDRNLIDVTKLQAAIARSKTERQAGQAIQPLLMLEAWREYMRGDS